MCHWWTYKDQLHQVDDVMMFHGRMFVPKSLCGEVLEVLHSARQGINGIRNAAKPRLFWPRIDATIKQFRSQCRPCDTNAPSHQWEEMFIGEPAMCPFQQLVVNYFSLKGHQYVVAACRFSGWVTVQQLSMSCNDMTSFICLLIDLHCMPEEISCDGGLPFNSSRWERFLKNWGIEHRLLSAMYPQSNGRAEVLVKSTKRILMTATNNNGDLDQDEVVCAMLQYKNMPITGIGDNPCQFHQIWKYVCGLVQGIHFLYLGQIT